ncbi:Periplasmic beta-glucosidase precursor, putative [Ricinus communis]|uniref:Periplasmic beta-glucosidase, putative n=1 Tax=Ricinus communis TaxID=3988 RepID=B9RJH1_RICCO|nr:Periplasmic beta-glucosidase precursor, putative [Ricinus communis]
MTLVGNYAGPPCKTVTPLQGLQNYIKNTKYHRGCNTVACSKATIREAVQIAREVDQVVLVMELDQTQEAERIDLLNLRLPGNQQKLIISVARAANKPVVLVLICGGLVDVSFAITEPKIGSILWAGYPGEAGGTALAEIIFGDHNPGGKLPVTWYPQQYTKIPMTDVRMRPQIASGYPGRSYRFYEGKKVFEFGYGLSYSNCSYEIASIPQDKIFLRSPSSIKGVKTSSYTLVSELGKELCERSKFSVTVKVKNEGKIIGKHPVLVFLRQPKPGSGRPVKKLVAFQTVRLNAGQNAEIQRKLSPCEPLTRANEDGSMVIDGGLVVGEKPYQITIIV